MLEKVAPRFEPFIFHLSFHLTLDSTNEVSPKMTNMKWNMVNLKRGRGRMLIFLACLVFAPSVAAQPSAQATASKNDSDSLHQFNSSIRALVRRVTPSVV